MLNPSISKIAMINFSQIKFTRTGFLVSLFLLLALLAVSASAAEVSKEQVKGLDEQVQDIKKDVLELTSELSRLEEKLLFPSNTQVSLFVSIIGDEGFVLDSMQIKMDNKVVAQHLYTYKEIEALRAGGVQRIYTGNIKTGDHQLVASFIGRAKSGNEYQRSEKFNVTKAVGPKFVEIQITGSSASDQTISFKDW
ncbi:MAG: hypothetical protein BMS9Abin19_0566 [Gammaproteobacteria bacterium]|nr:MAG: hypothetical protein BMS9Abin19_0566 [Gammaproteobacteria bacterium]